MNIADYFRVERTGSGLSAWRMVRRTTPSVQTTDSHLQRGLGTRRRTRDDILNAWSDGKQLALGTVWDGDLKPRFDTAMDEVKALVTGFTSGQVLHAEPVPADLDLGDVSDGLELIERGAVRDGVERIERAVADARRRKVARPTGDTNSADSARVRAQIHPPRVTGDFSKPVTPADVNKLNAETWAKWNSPTYNSGDATRELNAEKLRDAALRLRPR
jgi:hypothetical protein